MIFQRIPRNKSFDKNTKLLLHCNGANESTVFTDSSLSKHAVTRAGNAQISTAQYKFGGASALFDGNGDYLSIADSADWNFGSGNMTIEFWARFTNTTNRHVFAAQYYNSNNWWRFQWNESGTKRFQLILLDSGSYTWILEAAWTPSVDTWYHIALVRKGTASINDWPIFVDGTALGLSTDGGSADAAFWDLTSPLYIGNTGGGSDYMAGHLDEYRISNIARYPGNFTPSAVEFKI